MKKNEIEEAILDKLQWEKSVKQEGIGELLLAAFCVLILVLIIVVICFVFSVKMPFSTYKEIFIFVISGIALTVIFMVAILKSQSVSQRKVKRKAKIILKRLLSLRKKGKLDICYLFLCDLVNIQSPEELDQVISDLKEMLGYKNLADGGLHIG